MNPKIEITNKIAEILGLETDPKSIKKLIYRWWENPRNKSQGGLRLTEEGFESIKTANIKPYCVKLEHKITFYSNQLVIWLDRYINCPWFISQQGYKYKHNSEIYIFDDKMAVQLILFEGNVERFLSTKVALLKSY